MKLKCKNQILFWAAIDKDYWNVSVIRTFCDRHTFIRNINSQEIERRKDLSTEEKYKSWSRYFANNLLKSENHFFNTPLWVLKGYESNTRCLQPRFLFIEEDSFDAIHTGEWDQSLVFSKKVDVDSSRMKWWRKIARQDLLPPIFAWFIPSIGDYWIIDGNYRLKAALLENKPVSVIAAYSGYYKETVDNPEKQQAIMRSVQKALKNKDSLSSKTMKGINDLLMQAFDNRPQFSLQTFSKGRIKSEADWIKEVSEYLEQIDYPDWENEIKYIIE